MKIQLEKRLGELRAEFESGQKMLADLESKQANLRDTLLRISGAIQVLEEVLANESEQEPDKTGQFERLSNTEPVIDLIAEHEPSLDE